MSRTRTFVVGAVAAAAVLAGALGCASAQQTQTVNVRPGKQTGGYTAAQLAAARAWLTQPHPALATGWRYAVVLVANPKSEVYIDGRDCGDWASVVAYADGSLGVLCESGRAYGQAALLLGQGDAVAFDDRDHDQTFTLPTELHLIAKNVIGGNI